MATISAANGRIGKPTRISNIVRYGILYFILILLALFFLFPFYSMVIGSLMPKEELFKSYPQLWPPNGPQLTAYRLLLGLASPDEIKATNLQNLKNYNILRYIFNTLLLAGVAVALQVFFNTLAGYTFAKRQYMNPLNKNSWLLGRRFFHRD